MAANTHLNHAHTLLHSLASQREEWGQTFEKFRDFTYYRSKHNLNPPFAVAKPCQSSILVLSVWSYCSLASRGSVAAARLQNCADKTRPLHVLGEYVHWQYTPTLYTVIYSLHCAVYSVHSTVHNVHCTLYTLHCTYSRKYGHCQLYCNVLLQVSTHQECTVHCTLSCLAQFEMHTLFTLQFSLSSSVFVLCNVLYSVVQYNALIAVQCRTL